MSHEPLSVRVNDEAQSSWRSQLRVYRGRAGKRSSADTEFLAGDWGGRCFSSVAINIFTTASSILRASGGVFVDGASEGGSAVDTCNTRRDLQKWTEGNPAGVGRDKRSARRSLPQQRLGGGSFRSGFLHSVNTPLFAIPVCRSRSCKEQLMEHPALSKVDFWLGISYAPY